MNSRSKITTVAMAVALVSSVGFLHAQGVGGSSGSNSAREQSNDPLWNNNDQMRQQSNGNNANNAAQNQNGQTGQTNQGTSTSSQNNGNNNTTETWQDPNRGNQPMVDSRSQSDLGASSELTAPPTAAGSSDQAMPERADRN